MLLPMPLANPLVPLPNAAPNRVPAYNPINVAWPSFTPASNPKIRGIVFVPSITTNAATIMIIAFRMGTSNKSIAKIQLVNN